MSVICVDQSNAAEYFCICVYPLPALCRACTGNHIAKPGFHYLLSLSSASVLSSQQDWENWKPWFFQLDNSQKISRNILQDMADCEEALDACFLETKHNLEQFYLQHKEAIKDLRRRFEPVLEKAIQVTTAHATDSGYKTQNPLEIAIFNGASNTEALKLFKYQVGAAAERVLQVSYSISVPGFEFIPGFEDVADFGCNSELKQESVFAPGLDIKPEPKIEPENPMDTDIVPVLSYLSKKDVKFFDFEILQWRQPIPLRRPINANLGSSYVMISDCKVLCCGYCNPYTEYCSGSDISDRENARSAYIVDRDSVEVLPLMVYPRSEPGLVHCPWNNSVYVFGSNSLKLEREDVCSSE